MYCHYGKRFLDIVLSITALVLLSPLLALVGIFLRFDSVGPILFIQDRVGKQGVIFRAYKFRTMTHRFRVSDREIIGRDVEVTRMGYWLRRFKINEVPQLFNILKGDMSIVGPRPSLPEQQAEYNDVARKRLMVRPGLTGLAQVQGNIHLSWPERWQYDAWYV